MRRFLLFTVITVAGPVLWLWYNQHFMHDPLDFMRGPYSAVAIDKKTTPPGAKHYRGWHNPGMGAAVLHADVAGGCSGVGDGISADGGGAGGACG